MIDLVEKSEVQINRTYEMVAELSQTCKQNTEVYDKHLSSLEMARDRAQQSATDSVEVGKNLTDLLSKLREDYQAQLTALKAELHSLTNDYKMQLEDMRRDYKELSASYRRLAERVVGSSSKSDVKINM